jgi:hypothetical protein
VCIRRIVCSEKDVCSKIVCSETQTKNCIHVCYQYQELFRVCLISQLFARTQPRWSKQLLAYIICCGNSIARLRSTIKTSRHFLVFPISERFNYGPYFQAIELNIWFTPPKLYAFIIQSRMSSVCWSWCCQVISSDLRDSIGFCHYLD